MTAYEMRISDWSSDVCSSDLLLRLHRVDLEVVGLRILADDHALIERLAGRDEEDAALFHGTERVGDGFAVDVRDEAAVLEAFDQALVGAVFPEQTLGRAAGRERVVQYGVFAEGHGSFLKTKI